MLRNIGVVLADGAVLVGIGWLVLAVAAVLVGAVWLVFRLRRKAITDPVYNEPKERR